MTKYLVAHIVLAFGLAGAALAQPTGEEWRTPIATDRFHVVVFPQDLCQTLDGTILFEGDYIGAFYDSSGAGWRCAGLKKWTNVSDGFSMILYGDDLTTTGAEEGYLAGEVITWRVWRSASDEESDAQADYLPTGDTYSDSSHWRDMGVSGVADFTFLYFDITNPTPGDTILAATDHTVRWRSNIAIDQDTLVASYSLDGASFTTLAPADVFEDSAIWFVPAVLSDSAVFRVRARNTSASDRVDSLKIDWFALHDNLGGDTVRAGDVIPIYFRKSAAIDRVRVEYFQPEDSQTITDTATTSPYLWTVPGTPGEWRLRLSDATNASRNTAIDSTFTILVNFPAVPTPLAPENGATGLTGDVTFRWSDSPSATVYHLQIARDAGFTGLHTNNALITREYETVGEFALNTTYYWRVRAMNSIGESEFSDAWTFTTYDQPPDAPTLIAPADNATLATNETTLEWNSSYAATEYRAQVATDSLFTTIVDQATVTDTTYEANNLDYETEHFWRVSGINAAGEGAFSEIRTFLTAPAPPAPPTLVAPANGAQGLPTRVELQWNPVVAADSYDVHLATDVNFGNRLIDTTVADTALFADDLQRETKHYWRVRAKNDLAAGAWSSTFVFATGEQSITIVAPNGGEFWKAGFAYSLQWTSAGISRVILEFTTDLGATWTTIDTTSASLSVYSWTTPAVTSNRCRIRLTDASDTTYRITSAIPFMIYEYPDEIDIDISRSFGDASDYRNYRMIGLPGADVIQFEEGFSGELNADWIVYHDDGVSSRYLPYEGDGMMSFSAGKGYWCIARSPFTIKQTVPAVSLSSELTYAVALHSGWNIISSPFHKSVDWDDVRALNGIADQLWGYDEGFTSHTIMKPFEGYYYYNRRGASSLYLFYSPVDTTTAKTATAKTATKDDDLLIRLFEKGVERSTLRLGYSDAATGGLDSLDWFAPPAKWVPSLVVDRSDLDLDYPYFAADRREPLRDGESYAVRVRGDEGATLRARAEIPSSLRDYRVLLMDTQTGRAHNFIASPDATVVAGKPYALLVGTDDYVRERQAELLPSEFRLLPNYPNPFNPTTTIGFATPTTGRATATVYNALGERVKEIFANRRFEAGHHEFRFEANALAGGVYFYEIRFDADDGERFSQTGKMTLLK
ncbi:MAG: hypothetical protein GF419_05820 [Ignavibacteriales bacterium]|nr:hypothetical protein [Ignavibacteriales bacterium]